MSVTIQNRSPYQSVFVYEKLNDETGRPMHKSWGNSIDFGEAADRMGADVMRWMYASQNPVYNINFGYGPAHRRQAPHAHALERLLVLRDLRAPGRV